MAYLWQFMSIGNTVAQAVTLKKMNSPEFYVDYTKTVKVNPMNQQIPIQIFHGTQDMMVQEVMGRQALKHLQAMGFDPVYHTYPMGHEVCIEEIEAIGQALINTFV